MKNNLKILIMILLIIPITRVNALECFTTTQEKPLILENTENFPCSNIEGETLTFKYKDKDYSNYFEFNKEKERVNIKEKNIPFDTSEQVSELIISDGLNQVKLYVKNNSYVTTTSSTTTTNAKTITYTVTLDPNNGNEKTTKTCNVENEGDICYITLPNLETETFSGWGSASTCKEGNIGSTKVDKDITYYACYTNNETQDNENNNTNNEVLLSNLKVYDVNNSEEIDFGIFSIKKMSYEFKVLYEVKSLKVSAVAQEGIKIEYIMDEELKVGENEITIKLTDENNNTAEYKLLVTRLEEGKELSSIHYLKALVISSIDIKFNKDTFIYNITIPNDYNKLEFNAIPENEEDNIEFIGNENLEDGSNIFINVIGNDETTTTYTINITKESNMNYLLLGAIGIIIILIIVLIILILLKRNKNKKQKNNNKPETITNDNIEVLKF